jgi:hypothetical protein
MENVDPVSERKLGSRVQTTEAVYMLLPAHDSSVLVV